MSYLSENKRNKAFGNWVKIWRTYSVFDEFRFYLNILYCAIIFEYGMRFWKKTNDVRQKLRNKIKTIHDGSPLFYFVSHELVIVKSILIWKKSEQTVDNPPELLIVRHASQISVHSTCQILNKLWKDSDFAVSTQLRAASRARWLKKIELYSREDESSNRS